MSNYNCHPGRARGFTFLAPQRGLTARKPREAHCLRQPEIRAGGAVVVSPALQRGESVTNHAPESRRDGAFSSHESHSLFRKTECKNTNPGATPVNVKLLLPPRQSRGISSPFRYVPAPAMGCRRANRRRTCQPGSWTMRRRRSWRHCRLREPA